MHSQLLVNKRELITENSMVTAAHPLAAEAGYEILQQGGNAADAAVAAAFALAVVEPFRSGLGGGAYALAHQAESGTSWALDGGMAAPQQVLDDGEAAGSACRSVAVPGALAVYARLHQLLGRLPWSQLLTPAIELAAAGFVPDWYLFANFAAATERLRPFPNMMRTFYQPDGTPVPFPVSHDTSIAPQHKRLIQPDLAQTLQLLATEGADAFYSGAIGRAITACVSANGGLLTATDLVSYQVQVTEPLWVDYHQRRLGFIPSNGGGAALKQMFDSLEGVNLQAVGHNTAEMVQIVAAAQQQAFADHAADIGSRTLSPQTTHLTVVDKERNIVSLSASLGELFGSGVVVPGTGMILNNGLAEFPNVLSSGKRIPAAAAAALVFDQDAPLLALGSSGWRDNLSAVQQIIHNVVDFGMGLQTAVHTPRIHAESETIFLDTRFSSALSSQLQQNGYSAAHRESHFLNTPFGRPNGIYIEGRTGLLHSGLDPYQVDTALGS